MQLKIDLDSTYTTNITADQNALIMNAHIKTATMIMVVRKR